MRQLLGSQLDVPLVSVEDLKVPPGLATGVTTLDQFLWWKGLPKGGLTLCCGDAGLGMTSLWTLTAKQTGAKVAWIESDKLRLNPWALRQKGVNLKNVFWISPPKDLKQKLWALQELCAVDSFEMIGCSLEKDNLKSHQIVKLKKLASRHHVALVFFAKRNIPHPLISLNLEFQRQHILVLRAQHRPTPFLIERRELHAHALPEFVQARKSIGG